MIRKIATEQRKLPDDHPTMAIGGEWDFYGVCGVCAVWAAVDQAGGEAGDVSGVPECELGPGAECAEAGE